MILTGCSRTVSSSSFCRIVWVLLKLVVVLLLLLISLLACWPGVASSNIRPGPSDRSGWPYLLLWSFLGVFDETAAVYILCLGVVVSVFALVVCGL